MLTNNDIDLIRGVVKEEVESGLVPVRKDIKDLKKDVKKLRKDLTTTINFFDNRNLELEKKINITRNEHSLSELDFA